MAWLALPLGYKAFLPEGGLLPWWVVLLISCYVLLKMGLSLEHPCSVLGVWSPVTRAQVSKRYREISMCTHPDKLFGRTPGEVERGKLLFQRASEARDGLLAATREQVPGADLLCSTQLDDAIYRGLRYALDVSREVGAYPMAAYMCDYLYRLLTLQFDLTGTISSLLLLMTLYRTLAGFFGFLRDSGPLSTLIAALTTIIIGPLPTLLRFIALPLLRVEAFACHELLPFVSAAADADNVEIEGGPENSQQLAVEAEGVTEGEDAAEGAAKAEGSAAAAVADLAQLADKANMRTARSQLPHKEAPKRGPRQRPKAAQRATERQPSTKTELHQAHALCRMGEAYDTPIAVQPMRSVLALRTDPNVRAYAASLVQFELLLSTSKPVIPLCCLIATGQVFNGIFFSIATAQVPPPPSPARLRPHLFFGQTRYCTGCPPSGRRRSTCSCSSRVPCPPWWKSSMGLCRRAPVAVDNRSRLLTSI